MVYKVYEITFTIRDKMVKKAGIKEKCPRCAKGTLVTDVEDYHDLENLSIEEQLDLIPEYCKKHLSSEIAKGKVYWTLNGSEFQSEPLS